ncbi:uncharacterized protein LOC144142599 [Haemaphysalis longicornis]
MSWLPTCFAMAAATLLLAARVCPAVALDAEKQCDPPGVWQTGEALDETASKAAGANVSLIEPARSGKLQECVERCCKRDDCSVATVKVQDKGSVLCALFNCNPPEKCIFKKSARLLSLDRTATAFLRRVVADWPKYSNVEVHTGNLSSADDAATSSTSSSTSTTVDTTLPFVADVTTPGSVNNASTPSMDRTTKAATSAPKGTTEDSDANSPGVIVGDGTTARALNVTTESPTTHHSLGLSGILDLLNHVAETRSQSPLGHEASSSTDSDQHVSVTSQAPSTTQAVTESTRRQDVSSTTNADVAVSASSEIPEQPSSTRATTRSSTTVSPALEASMEKIIPAKSLDRNVWWSGMSVPLKAPNPVTNASVVTASANATDQPVDPEKVNDLRRPIQIFAPTTLNVDLMPKASPSISLVIGLCLGLLLIFVVMGLIGRRILDVWQRRHYSKMDFLVDGMYHVT